MNNESRNGPYHGRDSMVVEKKVGGGGYQVRCSDTKPPFPCVLSINESINGPYHGRELHGGGRGKGGFGIR